MDLIKKLPDDIKKYLSQFIFLKCNYCNKKIYLKEELVICDECKLKICKKHTIIDYCCNNCLEDFLVDTVNNFDEFVEASCIIT